MKYCNILIFSFLLFQVNIISNTKLTIKEKYKFIHIGIHEGLSQSSVIAMLQDQKGYMWFCTANGLNRFDGYEFVVYTKDSGDSSSISDNYVSAIFEDKAGNIWIGTASGVLNRFTSENNEFKHYDIASSSDWYSSSSEKFYNYPIAFSRNSNSTITSIAEDQNGDLWIGTWGKGLIKFNPLTNKKKYFYFSKNDSNSISSNKIVKIVVDKLNYIWVGTFGGGLNRIDNKKNIKFIHYNESGKIGGKIASLYLDDKNDIWVGSYTNGITVIKNSSKINTFELKNYNIKNSLNLGLSRNDILSITKDHNGDMWFGTFGGGLFRFSENKFYNIVSDLSDKTSLSENEILSLCVDRSGVLWVGTHLGSGINKLDISSSKFFSLPINTKPHKSLNDNIVWTIIEDKEKDLWIGTYRGGINKYNTKKNEYTYYKKNKNGISCNHIRTIVKDQFENLWIGTYKGGLSFYNSSTNTFKNFSSNINNPSSLSFDQVQSLYIENDTMLWVGTFGGGLNKLSLSNFYKHGKAEFYAFKYNPANPFSISDDRIYTIYKSANGQMWIGTHGGGLNKFNEKENSFMSYKLIPNSNSISDNRIMVIHETANMKLLIGTFGGGLDLFDPVTEKFTSLNATIDLTCDDVYGILEDKSKRFWLSTGMGIFKLEKDLKSFTRYDINDGLQSLEFSGGAYFKSSDGTFYFGGINGLNYFNPDSIVLNNYSPSVVISKIKIFDSIVQGEKDRLVLEQDQNYFSFEFASLDYTNSAKNKYKYILEGLNDKWIYTDATQRKVNYTNLDPGKYVFKVMGTNSDGIWNRKETKIDIEILSPFWMRWWFIVLVLLSVGSIIAFILFQKIKYLLALDKLKSNLSADLHDNVGSGLTEISILSEIVSNELHKPTLATKHLNHISQLSRELVETMSDIVWVVNPQRDSLYDLIVRLKDSYGEVLGQMDISLVTLNLEKLKNIKLPIEKRQNLYLIFKEALNNSIKHSECTKVKIEFTINGNKLAMCLSDNGKGFDNNKKSLGEGLKNIIKRAKKLKGKVSIISDGKNGTTIKYEGLIK